MYYKKTFPYKLLLKVYLSVRDAHRLWTNKKYNSAVSDLLASGLVEDKIKKLETCIINDCTVTYYVIRRENNMIGLLTYVSIFLGHIAYALEQGFVPVIDMKNFKSIYLKNDEVGKINAWELYFQQPCNINLEDIEGQKIIYSPKYTNPQSPFISSLTDENEMFFWKILSEKYIRFNERTQKYYDSEFDRLLRDKKVLGLLYRGTDYLTLKPKKHPIQPTVKYFLEQIDSCLEIWGDFDVFYLATDDEKVMKILNTKYPDKIVVNQRTYYDNFKNIEYLAQASFDRKNDNYLKGLEYLSSIKLLSNAHSIIAGMCAGAYAANFLKPTKFANSYFFNLGEY